MAAARAVPVASSSGSTFSLTTLTFSKKHVAKRIEKTMRSAMANAIQGDSAVDVEDLYVKEALVGPGPIALTVTPWGAHSTAMTFVIPATPNLLAQ